MNSTHFTFSLEVVKCRDKNTSAINHLPQLKCAQMSTFCSPSYIQTLKHIWLFYAFCSNSLHLLMHVKPVKKKKFS